MFDIGFREIVLIAVVALISVGPKDIPQLLFKFGRMMRQVRIFTNQFRNSYSEVMHDIELDHYRKEFENAQKSLEKSDGQQ